jgi:hypothetical protein
MVAVAGVVADRFLEGEVLFASEHEQAADRRIDIGSVSQNAPCDADAGLEGDWIGGIPTRSEQGTDKLLLGPDETDIQGIAGLP